MIACCVGAFHSFLVHIAAFFHFRVFILRAFTIFYLIARRYTREFLFCANLHPGFFVYIAVCSVPGWAVALYIGFILVDTIRLRGAYLFQIGLLVVDCRFEEIQAVYLRYTLR